MSKPTITYLATPYSHPDPAVMEWRYQGALRAAAALMERGHVVFSPIAHSHEIGKHLGKQAGGHLDGDVHSYWMRQDMPWLAAADELVVLMLPGWLTSRGVKEEIECAKSLKMPVRFLSCLEIELPPPPHGAVADADEEEQPVESTPASDPIKVQTFGPLRELKDTNPKDAVGTRKAPLSTVPTNVIAEIGVGMLEGASKYGRHNYRVAGVRASVYFDALLRHAFAWWEGEDIDPDSGMHHVVKALCTLVVLRDAQHQGMCEDDRPPRSKPFYGALNERAESIVNRYADRAPRHYTIADGREEP